MQDIATPYVYVQDRIKAVNELLGTAITMFSFELCKQRHNLKQKNWIKSSY